MNLRLLSNLFWPAVLLLSLPLVPAHAEPGLEAESLWHWEWAGDPQLSPDGRHLVYVRVAVDREGDTYTRDLWLKDLETQRHRPLTTHEANDSNPRFSPDGKRVAFTSTRRDSNQIWVIGLDSGEARPLTELEGGAGSPVWSPDGEQIAFSSRARTAEERREERDAEREQRAAEREARGLDEDADMESAPEPTVIDRLQYQQDGRSDYLPETRPDIWLVAVGDQWPADPERVTDGRLDYGSPSWSADGEWLYFSGLLEDDADWRQESHIYRIAASGDGEPEQLTPDEFAGERPSFGNPMPSPGGDTLAFTGNTFSGRGPSYALTELYLMDADGGEPRKVSGDYDRSIGDGGSGDATAPGTGVTTVDWSPDGQAIWFTTADRGQTHLARYLPEADEIARMTDFDQGDIAGFAVGGDRVAKLWSDPQNPYQLYTARTGELAERDQWTRLSHLAAEPLEGVTLSEYEEVWYESFDGQDIQGWVIRPPDFDPDQSYPAVLYVHGGPHAMYGTGFFHEFQVWANAGYVVMITNPRGSSGYGEAFGNVIQYEYPGDDHHDLMAGVDWLEARPYVDEDRLGITGGSGGGLLTLWAITRTDRFAVAAAQRSVTNWHSFVGTADMNHFFVQRWFPTEPWEDPMAYLERSPLNDVDQVDTPTLLIHSEEDWRTPLEQTRQFYAQLRMQQKPARMVIFPEASHGLSRTGRPGQRITRIDHLLDWFDEYLEP